MGEIDWSPGAVRMYERHGISVGAAEEALADECRVVLDPDPASRSGHSVRVIGWTGTLLAVILVREEGRTYGGVGVGGQSDGPETI